MRGVEQEFFFFGLLLFSFLLVLMDTGLKGRGVIVAASSSGIGRATAEAFAREGAQVAMCARTQKGLQAAAGEIRTRYGAEILAETVDVTDSIAVRDFVEHAAKQFGRLDVCVCNAGGPPARQFLQIDAQEWRRAVDLNLMSTIYLAREVIPHMRRHKWGRIIAINSIVAKQPIDELVTSNAVRAAVMGLVKSLSNEFAKDNILVNNVAPGYTETERLNEIAEAIAESGGPGASEVRAQWAKLIPLGRIGRAEEIADAIVWLASERASYVTGQTLVIDGGFYKGL